MCIYCDLGKDNEDGKKAKIYTERAIQLCNKMSCLYRDLLCQNIVPHNKTDMEGFILTAKSLTRILINEIL